MSNEQLAVVEKTLTKTLVGWAAANIGAGTTLAVTTRESEDSLVHQFGRQSAAWGAVNAAIAGFGLLAQHRRGILSADESENQVHKLRRLLVINAVADIGYVAGGVFLVARGRRNQKTLRMGAGDGAAIVVQGMFLLALDVSQARRLG